MAKKAEDRFFDGAFDNLKNNVNRMYVCSAQPTTYTEAITTYALGFVAVASGDFTTGDGDVSGRKVTVAAKTINGSANGTGNHIALVKTGDTTLWYVTTCTSVAMSTGVDQDFSAWDIEILDPT